MADYIFNSDGRAQGFRVGPYLYDLSGKAVGRVSAERVYKLSGEYVGELFKNMVVEKPTGVRRNLPAIAYPGDADPPPADTSRGAGDHSFPDVFERLVGGSTDN